MNTRKFLKELFFRDVEKGLTEDSDNLQPLLSRPQHDGRNGVPPTPRPEHLSLLQPTRHQPKMNVALPENTPSSSASTANNTPQAETASSFHKKWRRSDRRLRRLNTELLEAIEAHNVEEVERLLKNGANPNATCRMDLVSACHMASILGGDSLSLLLKHGAERHRLDRLGRTPLHLAAWAGNARQVAILLDIPEDMHDRVENTEMSSDTEEDIKKLCPMTRELANVRSDLGEVNMQLPKTWKDNIDHHCRDIKGTIPAIQPGWTPLHIASACARRHCTRLLLAAGADPNICDVAGRTSLDVVGLAHYYDETINPDNFAQVIKMLLKSGGIFNTMKPKGLQNMDTPLHTSVELESTDAIKELLEAGACICCLNNAGLTPLHVCVNKELEECLQILANYGHNDDPMCAMVDVKDKDGHTVLQAAIEAAWVPGVCVALEAGANVTLKANDGETPIHSAAALGNLDVLNEILSVAKLKDALDFQNDEGETALFKAIVNGHLDCVRAILNEGASIKITLPGNFNVLHAAAENGQLEIIKELLKFDEETTQTMLNSLTDGDRRGFGPIHFAVSNNYPECVEYLLSKKADIRLRTTCSPHKSSTPLHIAAVKNHSEIAKIILNIDKTTIHEVNSMGWFPLHSAAHHGSRDVITLLLRDGADLSGYTDGPKKFRRSAFDMILNNLSKPTEYMEEIFDSYIHANDYNFQDTNCVVTVDYRILMPTICEMEQMKVIERLLKTGNRFGQRRLLVHPLVESFLYLKWKALLPFFYTIIAFYGMFLMSLTIFIISVFFYKDTEEIKPNWLGATIWSCILYTTTILILLQELLYMNVKSSRYFLQLETWVKFGSIGLAAILPSAVTVASWSQSDWPRHVATVALLLSWIEMMFLLSRFPNWGYYVLMFGKVASNVVKILLTFAFLVIGFSLSFMIEFRTQAPFDGPFSALVKTIVMMTSEFDYQSLFDEEHAKDLSTSISIVRFIFVVFLVLAAIVLMNLMVGVAVNDINDLEILGNIRRLAKQVEFLGTLDTLVYNRLFNCLFPKRINNRIKNKRKVLGTISLCPGKPRWKHYKLLTTKLREAILEKALRQKKEMEDQIGFQEFKNKIDDMYEAIMKKPKEKEKDRCDLLQITNEERPLKQKMRHDEIIKRLSNLDDGMIQVKEKITTNTESKISLDELNVKMDQMSLDIEAIKAFLNRLESKLKK